MRAEDKYKAQMVGLGIWQEAFAPEVHTLCMMERELRRAQKEQKELEDDAKARALVYQTILQLRRDILSHRDALGLTPKGLQRLTGREGLEGGGGTQGGVIVLADVIPPDCPAPDGAEQPGGYPPQGDAQ